MIHVKGSGMGKRKHSHRTHTFIPLPRIPQKTKVAPPIQGAVVNNPLGKIPPGNKVIAVVTPFLDQYVDKIMGEFGEYFLDEKASIVIFQDSTPANEILRVTPDILVMFRAGIAPKEQLGAYAENLRSLMVTSRAIRIPIVYYMDDFAFSVNDNLPIKLASSSDRVIVANNYLKHCLYEVGIPGPVIVMPTHVSIEKMDALPVFDQLDMTKFNVVMSLMGGTGLNSIAHIFEYVEMEPEKYKRVEFTIVSREVALIRAILNKYRRVNKRYWEFLPVKDYYGLIKGADVVITSGEPADIAHLVPEPLRVRWLNAKCPIKYCVAGTYKVPIITAPHMPYVDSIKHGETGFICGTVEEFMICLDLFMEHPEIAKEVGENARKDIEKNWDVKKRFPEFRDAINGKEEWTVPLTRPGNAPIEQIGWILCGNEITPSARIEGINLHNWLISKGKNSKTLTIPNSFRHFVTASNEEINTTIKGGFDCIIFQKVCMGDAIPMAQKFRACNIRTIWSISDLLEVGFIFGKVAGRVVTTNNYLKSKFPEDMQNIITIIKDAYETPRELCKTDYKQKSDKLSVLWFGSASHYEFASKFRSLLTSLGMEYTMISSPDAHPDKVWSLESIPNDIMNADIVIIPSSLDEFEKCKDENRAVQCMVLGTPVITDPIPSYLSLIRDGENGYIANNQAEWVIKLMQFRDEATRERIGRQGRLDVIDAYNIDTIGEQWLKEITQ